MTTVDLSSLTRYEISYNVTGKSESFVVARSYRLITSPECVIMGSHEADT